MKNTVRVVVAGHVDHGKSTLIGRLLYDTDSLQDGLYEQMREAGRSRGAQEPEWAYLLDAFQAERNQSVTIDTTQIRFSTDRRAYVIIDAPGHREFLKNMISGAAGAEAAILVIDATEGVCAQTCRHAYLLSLLGVRQIALAINKMDSADYSEQVFQRVKADAEALLDRLGLKAGHAVPVSARKGDMVAVRGEAMRWYTEQTLVDVFDSFSSDTPPVDLPARFPVQDVYREQGRRILAGRVETGVIRKGDVLLFSPSNEKAVVASIEVWPPDAARSEAIAGESVGITLEEPLFVERGQVASHEQDAPMVTDVFRARLFWAGVSPLEEGGSCKMRCGPSEVRVAVQSIERVTDAATLLELEDRSHVPRNAIADVTLRAGALIAADSGSDNGRTGRFVLCDETGEIVAGGTMDTEGFPDRRHAGSAAPRNITGVAHLVSAEERAIHKGHKGGVFWLTGLSGAGKSTLAMAAERLLHKRGRHTYVLDGDNMRSGLNADLGFTPEGRAENIRRAGEVAALMADAGLIVLAAFISPYRHDRDGARQACPACFHEIFVSADLETCEARDPKGLYRKARAGKIQRFTGVDAPYEKPEKPELILDTRGEDVDRCADKLAAYIELQTGTSIVAGR